MQLLLLKLEWSAPFSSLASRTVENQLKNSNKRETKMAKDSKKTYCKGREFSGLREDREQAEVFTYTKRKGRPCFPCVPVRLGVRKLPSCQTSQVRTVSHSERPWHLHHCRSPNIFLRYSSDSWPEAEIRPAPSQPLSTMCTICFLCYSCN